MTKFVTAKYLRRHLGKIIQELSSHYESYRFPKARIFISHRGKIVGQIYAVPPKDSGYWKMQRSLQERMAHKED